MFFTQKDPLHVLFILAFFILAYVIIYVKYFIIPKSFRVNYKYVFLKFVLRFSYFCLLIIALLGPSLGNSKKKVSIHRKNILFSFDISRSMDCKDVLPSRFLISKMESIKMIDSLSTCNIGVTYFSKQAYLLCPFTSDIEAVKSLISTINPYNVYDKGTDFNINFELALDKFKDFEKYDLNMIVLFTDGDYLHDISKNTINKILKSDIKVCFVKTGTEKGSKIPYKNYYLLNKDSRFIWSSVDKNKFNIMKKKLDAQIFEISENINESNKLVHFINTTKSVSKNEKIVDTKSNKYYYFLIIALFLISIDFFVNFKIITT